jgi:hypothetical protein
MTELNNMLRMIPIAFAIGIIALTPGRSSALDPDINTTLLRSSYKIIGQNGIVGTCFIIGKHIKGADDSK